MTPHPGDAMFRGCWGTIASSCQRNAGGCGMEIQIRRRGRCPRRLIEAAVAAAAMIVSSGWTATAVTASASPERVIYSFAGGGDGEYPSTDLITDGAGNLYGTSVEGGRGGGTVFQ